MPQTQAKWTDLKPGTKLYARAHSWVGAIVESVSLNVATITQQPHPSFPAQPTRQTTINRVNWEGCYWCINPANDNPAASGVDFNRLINALQTVTCSCGKTAHVTWNHQKGIYVCMKESWRFRPDSPAGWYCGEDGHHQQTAGTKNDTVKESRQPIDNDSPGGV